MKIYRLDLSEIQNGSFSAISSQIAIRTTKKQEFYSSHDKARDRQTEIQAALQALIGYTSNFEVTVTAIEVIE